MKKGVEDGGKSERLDGLLADRTLEALDHVGHRHRILVAQVVHLRNRFRKRLIDVSSPTIISILYIYIYNHDAIHTTTLPSYVSYEHISYISHEMSPLHIRRLFQRLA